MSYVAPIVLLICLLAGGTLFFSVNTIALRIFSRVKLQEAFKAANKKGTPENLTDGLVKNGEKLILTCSLYRLIFNMCILLLLVASLSTTQQAKLAISDYLVAFIIAEHSSGSIPDAFNLFKASITSLLVLHASFQ